MGWFDEGGSASPVDVPAMFDSGLPAAVTACVEAGALVSMGTTSDGGALGITVTLDGRWRREYFREVDDAIDWLLQAAEAVRAEGRPASSGRGRRTRRS